MSDETCCGACGYPVHATKEMACDWCRQSADRIEGLVADLARSTRMIAKMVPLSADGNYVFWDGVGDIELDHNGKLRTGIEEATKALLEIHRIVPLHPAGDIALATLKKLKEMDHG